jgi:[acyl-carrier-protein] S-malonyltransferase
MTTAFLFPGQGSQSVGMGGDLASERAAKTLFDAADQALGFSITKIFLEGPEETLKLTAHAQPALLTVGVACARILEEKGVRPQLVAGHSLGEYAALVIAGSMRFEDAIRTVHKRGLYMQEAVPVGQGAMAAILGLEIEAVTAICDEAAGGSGHGQGDDSIVVQVANDNAPGQVVIAGSSEAVERAIGLAREKGARRALKLAVSAPFHCRLMQPAQDRLSVDLDGITFSDPQMPLVCNVDAEVVADGQAAREALKRQVTGRVRWTESVRRLIQLGATSAIECGPGKVLSGLSKRIDRNLKMTPTGDLPGIKKALEIPSPLKQMQING